MQLVVGFVLATLLSGCTYRLWETDGFTSYRYPSPDPKLVVFHDRERNDYVTCYDELSDKKGTIERRAFLVRANGDVTERGRKPAYVQTIPTNLVTLPKNPRQPVPPFVTETNAVFTIHETDQVIGPMPLPTYQENSGVPTKIALTPLAIVVDATVVGIVAGLMFPGAWTGAASR